MGFIVIEGLDGSGKSTQLTLLGEYMEKEGIPYKYLHFPRLETGVYGKLIARFLRGELGAIQQVDPYLVALMFAGDRTDAAPLIRQWMDEGYLVVADRYVYSNIAYQCAKLETRGQRDRLRDWILEFEFGYNSLPRPDLNLFLDVPFHFTRQQLESMRDGEERAYLKGERDIHEENLEFQEQVRQEYLALQQSVADIILIDCTSGGMGMRPPRDISETIIQHLNLKK
jgi:dTMP kinase